MSKDSGLKLSPKLAEETRAPPGEESAGFGDRGCFLVSQQTLAGGVPVLRLEVD